MPQRIRISVKGAVQGVGFRPFVYGLATRLGLAGSVLNDVRGVEIELEGPEEELSEFEKQLRESPPALAVIREIKIEKLPVTGQTSFEILFSESEGARTVMVVPDQATCPDCLRELRDPKDRRHRYPFINCTNCGPRYTIIRDVPYDRANTTMAAFPMCAGCRAEYEDPANRRFHAEPTCCPLCGPQVWLTDASGAVLPCEDPVAEAKGRLAAGQTVAVKGLGGFHLACDAANDEAVRLLRRRKNRDLKPFALMVKDLVTAERICEVPEAACAVLTGRERPILLLRKRAGHGLSEHNAPRNPRFGVMLPYTPLHHLLLEGPCSCLVMTSGNISDEPIAYTNEDALERLADLTDVFLLHDRDIETRADDSVAHFLLGKLRFIRRSRGYAPFPADLPLDTGGREILATGPELKNTVCLTRGSQAYLSHHIGDLQNMAAYESFLQAIDHLGKILDVEPAAIAVDLHPDYMSTRYATARDLPLIQMQHHHAHVASVLAEAGRTDKVIGVSYDGLGWGDDGQPWGGEFLLCDLAHYERVGYLSPVPLPGGDATTKRPPRMAYVYLRAAFAEGADALSEELLPELSAMERQVLKQMIGRTGKTPLTASMGRLFDAASALLCICDENTYEGQAPMELEACAWEASAEQGAYPAGYETSDGGPIRVLASEVIRAMAEDYRSGAPKSVCAARFHNSIVRMTVEVCERLRRRSGLGVVALSGGVFANAFLVERLAPALEAAGFEVLLNTVVPPGDGGVSLGQAAAAAWRLSCA